MKQILTWLNFLPARWLVLLTLTIYLWTYAGVLHSVDELATLTLTESFLVEQRWHTNQMAWDQNRTPPQNAPGIDQNLYSKKGIGISLMAMPFFAMRKILPTLGSIQLALLANSFLTTGTVYLFYRLAITLHHSRATAALGALALGLATPLWPYARTLFSEALAVFGLSLALWGAFCYRAKVRSEDLEQDAAVNRSDVIASLCWTSCGLALLLLARSANAILAPPFLAYLVYTTQARPTIARRLLFSYQSLMAFGLPLGGVVLMTLFYNYTRFHTWFTFPQAAFETFSTPFVTGLTGLLLSPGKGLLWYMPVTLLLLWGLPYGRQWRLHKHFAEYGLAATLILITLLFYAKWYDWTGGRAWGPRLLVMTAPAWLILCLPVLDRLHRPQRLARWWISGLLLLSFLVQLPGVLLNFEWLEAEQMKAGVTFAQLVWSLPHSPLLTYWRSLFMGIGLDPAWWQATFWQHTWPLTGAFIMTGVALVLTLGIGIRRACRQQRDGVPWMAGVSLALLFAMLTVRLAAGDPRWQEGSANPADNIAVVEYLRTAADTGDVVLLDMTDATDQQGRQRFWMNNGVNNVPYLAWVRNSEGLTLDEQLIHWLSPYSRIWLIMQETVEEAPDAATERWLDQHAYRGRQLWIGSQRIVEYMAANGKQPLVTATTPIHFGNAAVLAAYQLHPGRWPDYLLLHLTWEAQPAPEWRFSVQGLDSSGQVVVQLDDRPARLPGLHDQRGLTLPPTVAQLVLKMYDSQNGQVAPVQGVDEQREFLTLFTWQQKDSEE